MGRERRNVSSRIVNGTRKKRVTVMDILHKNSKKEYQKSVTGLSRLEEKRIVQGVYYFINKFHKFI
jgi:hypothetical protein